MKKILTLGLGKVGTLVATLLSKTFEVTGLDHQDPPYAHALPFKVVKGDVGNADFMRTMIGDADAVVSALPFFLNKPLATIAYELGKHYFDLTEDVPTTNYVLSLSPTARAVMAPQCGLAPGIIGIIGAHLAQPFERLRSIEMRVGALPKHPNGRMAYSFTWSPAGVVNEYINDAEAIHHGERKMVPSLEGLESLNLNGIPLEAFYTSGGLGTMCATYEGKLQTLNYKTMRYPGHSELMKFLIHELHLRENKTLLEELLKNAKPPVDDDVVHLYAAAEGWLPDGKLFRSEYCKAFYPKVIDGVRWRAISWTTAASVAAVVELVANGVLVQTGFVKQEEIPFEAFLNTQNGQFFAD